MSAGAILCLVLLVLYATSHADIEARRRRRRGAGRIDISGLPAKQRGRAQMRAEIHPAYPPPPVMPTEDLK